MLDSIFFNQEVCVEAPQPLPDPVAKITNFKALI
jgi:hypothetical protein